MSPDRSDVVGEKLRSGAARRCRVWLQPKQVSRIDTSGRHLQCGKSVSRVARYAFQIGPKSAQPRRGGCPPCRLCYRRLGTICATSRGDPRRGLGGSTTNRGGRPRAFGVKADGALLDSSGGVSAATMTTSPRILVAGTQLHMRQILNWARAADCVRTSAGWGDVVPTSSSREDCCDLPVVP